MNRVILFGTVMYPPQMSTLPDGRPVANVKLKTRKGLDIDCKQEENCNYEVFQLVFIGNDCDIAMSRLAPGDILACTGKLFVKNKPMHNGMVRTYLNVHVEDWDMPPANIPSPCLKRPRYLTYGEDYIDWGN